MELEQAIEQGNQKELIELLLKNPASIDELTKDGTPLALYAAKSGNLAIVRYIVEYSRASMNTVDKKHRTILHFAAMSGDVELNRYLVEKVGMKITEGDADCITPYQIAFEMGHQKLLAYYASCVGVPYQDMYHNPIRQGMFPDPSIVRVNEDYYMVNSSFIFFPCIPISHSKDLIHWEIIGHAITNPQWAKLGELEGGRGYWAPDISYDNGTFYITATYRLNDTGTVYRKQIVVSSKNPKGPYSKPAIIDEDGIDPSIFHEDGRHYMLLNRGARIFELNEDCSRQISEAELLYYGDQKRAPEGPHLLKKDGYYYLYLAEGGTGPGHRITVARSRTLMGNYEPCPYNPIMRQMDEGAAIQRCGHGKAVCTQNGEWYMVYLCGRMIGEGYSMLGRETALDPITWTADGWPIVNALNGPSVLQKRPNLPTFTRSKEENIHDWMTPREPEENGVVFLENGFRILGSKESLSSVKARNILLRRQTAFSFLAETAFLLPDLLPEQEAGLTCYYDENTWVCFFAGKNADGKWFVQVKEHIGKETICHAPFLLDDDKKLHAKSRIVLRVECAYLERKFFVNTGKGDYLVKTLDNVWYLCDEGIKMGKRFTGAMVGMYAYSGKQTFYADFEFFHYLNKTGREGRLL